MHAAENNNVGCSLLGFLSQRQTVAYIVGQLLYLMALVVVSKYDGVLFPFQPQYFLFQFFVGHINCINFKVQKY